MEFDVRYIAHLAQLKVSEDEIPALEKELAALTEMLGALPELDEDDRHSAGREMLLREDKAVPCSSSPAELLANALELRAGCIAIPKTVD